MSHVRQITYNKQQFILLLQRQMASSLGLSVSEAIGDIQFTNNTVVIKVDSKIALQNKRAASLRSDVLTSIRQHHGRG
jgi:sulfur carrier protein ThiS